MAFGVCMGCTQGLEGATFLKYFLDNGKGVEYAHFGFLVVVHFIIQSSFTYPLILCVF